MAVELIPPGAPEFAAKFHHFRYSVFRLETLQVYRNSGEDEALAAFLSDGYVPVTAELQAWTEMLRSNRQAGRTQQRAHVVTEPLTDYVRFELTGYAPNVEAGEDIRIIPVREGEGWPLDVPREHDYFLFDSHELYDQHYDDTGWWLGTEPVSDPARVAQACRWRDAALHQAMPWKDYMDARPELTKRVRAFAS
jgi:hypothetical protein